MLHSLLSSSCIYVIFISFPLDSLTHSTNSSVDAIYVSFILVILSPSSIPVFSYGLYILLSIPSISDIPTTNTPLVYSFTPAMFPTGITVVFGITDTSIFFINSLSNRLIVIFSFPT